MLWILDLDIYGYIRMAEDKCARFVTVRAQPYLLKGRSLFHADAVYNQRRCEETLHDMVKELAERKKLKDSYPPVHEESDGYNKILIMDFEFG
jgi:hypothetical protein